MQRFELIEGSSSKFWEISRNGSTYTVRYGRIGTNGQTLSKTAASDAKAQTEVDKLIKEKTGKGYSEVAVAGGATLAAVPVKAAAPKPVAVVPAVPEPLQAGDTTMPAADAKPESRTASVKPSTVVTTMPMDAAEPSGVFQYTAAWRKALPSQRGYDVQSVLPSLDGLYTLMIRLGATDMARLKWLIPNSGLGDVATKFSFADLYSRASLSVPDAERWETALLLGGILQMGDSYICSLPMLVELCVAQHGVVFATARYLAAMAQLPTTAQNWYLMAQSPGIDELAAALTRCSDDEYAKARAQIGQTPAASNSERFARGAVFNTDAEWVADAVEVADLNNFYAYESAASLTGARLTLAQAERLIKGTAIRDNADAVRRLALNLVRLHGAAAIPTLVVLYDRQNSTPTRTLVAEILRAFDSCEAFAELIERIDHKEVRTPIDQFAQAWPYAAMRAAAISIARSRNKSAEAWLKRMLAAHPRLIEPLRNALEGAATALLDRLTDKLVALTDAPLEALPVVLRDPPWLKPQPKSAARPLLPPTALPEARMLWPEGLREQWKKNLPANEASDPDSNKQKSRLGQALESLSIPRSLWSGLMSGELTDLTPYQDEIEAHRRSRTAYYRLRHISELSPLAPRLRLLLWNLLPAFDAYTWEGSPTAGSMLAHYELAALPGLLTFTSAHMELGLIAALPVAAAPIAPLAAQGLTGKKSRAPAAAWLRMHAELATTALLAHTQTGNRKATELAEYGLRWLAANVERSRLDEGARYFGAEGEALLAAIIAIDSLSLLPQKPRALPGFYLPGAYARPRLLDGSAVPAETLGALGTMLQVSLLDQPYAGIEQIKASCTAASLDEFAWDLFQSWYQCGAPSKESWAYTAMGLIGGELCVRELTPLIRLWPGEAQHARAVTGLDILAGIGSDLALMNLNGIAQKAKFKGLQERANEKVLAIADARGLTPEELADRLVPDLDLDEQGSMLLDFGPRQFTVGFDEQLRPFALDSSGARLKDLPKPIKSDDAERAGAASERWKLLKKDVKSIASNQVQRLEMAMCSGRTFAADVFQQFFVRHPLLRHLVRRLLWGVQAVDGSVTGFRVAEDLTYADRDDQTLHVADDALICLPHVLNLNAEDLAGFGQIFADYEILQPFLQLGREPLLMNDEELAQKQSQRFKGKRVAIGSVYGLQHRGWRSGGAQDGGWIGWFEKSLPGGLEAQIDLEPGTIVGDINYEPKQTLGLLTLRKAGTWNEGGMCAFATLNPIARSELLRDLDRLTPLVE
jgi:predicted DNA-binding WGR domain protein